MRILVTALAALLLVAFPATAASAAEPPACDASIAAAPAPAGCDAPGEDAEGFLGPIGWLWNTVYYRVYQGNAVMMATVGWALFLAPVILVFAGVSVIRGATSAFHRQTKTPPAALSVNE